MKKGRNDLPRYTYRCDACAEYFEVFHSIHDRLADCKCGSEGSLKRVPSLPFRVSINQGSQKPGEVVREFIEDTRREIEEEKRSMKGELDDI